MTSFPSKDTKSPRFVLPCRSAAKGLYLVLFIKDYLPLEPIIVEVPCAHCTSAATYIEKLIMKPDER